MKKVLSAILAVVMALSLLPVQVLAEDAGAADDVAVQEETVEAEATQEEPAETGTPQTYASGATYSGSLGEKVTWSLDVASGELTVSGSGAMGGYGYESSPLWNYRGYIKTVTIEEGITSVGDYVFQGSSNLTAVIFPDSITRIGNSAFSDCSALETVAIPEGVTEIGNSAFYDCDALQTVDIPDSVITIGSHAFYSCGLTAVAVGSGVIAIDSCAFQSCYEIKEVTISNIAAWLRISFRNEEANPLSYAHALYLDDELLTDLVIPGTVTEIGQYALNGCTSITSVYIPTSVASIGQYAFNGMSGLCSVRYAGSQEDWLKIQVGSYNESLTGLTPQYDQSIEDYCRITAAAAEHGTVTFDNALVKRGDAVTIRALPDPGYEVECYLVDGAVISGNTFTVSGDHVVSATFTKVYDVADDGKAYGRLGSNVTWALDTAGTVHIYGSGAMSDYGYGKSPLLNYRADIKAATIGKGVTSVGSCVFYECDALETVAIAASVAAIGDNAFSYCKNLISAEFLGDAPATFGSGVFFSRSSFFTILCHSGTAGWTEPTWNGYPAVCCDAAIADHSALDSENRNAQGIFFRLDETSRTAAVGTATTDDNNSGYRGGQNGVVYIPDEVTKDGAAYRVIGIGQYAFANCPWVKRVEVGRNLSSIIPSAFQGCKNLTAIAVDDGNLQFSGCDGVLYDKEALYLYVYPAGKADAEYDIPATCTTIGTKAFYGAVNLKTITVPATVTDIGVQAFSGCNNLEEITLPFIGGNAESGSMFSYVFGSDSWSSYGGVPQSLKTVTVLTANLGDSAFYNCSAIEEIYLLDCGDLWEIPEYCFSECASLKKLVFGGDESAPYAGVYIPNTVTQIGRSAFCGCASLPVVTLGREVSYIGSAAFYGCEKIARYAVAEENAYFAADKWGVLYNKDMTTLRYYPSGRTWPYYNVSEAAAQIDESAFSACETLVNLFVPSSVTAFGAYSGNRCISGCPYMTVCCYQSSAAARYAVSNGLTAWYMDNYTLQGITVEKLPEQIIIDPHGRVRNTLYVTGTYGDKTLQLDDFDVQLSSAYGPQLLTFSSGDVSTQAMTTVIRQGDVNGDGTAAISRVDAGDMQCLYTYLATGKNEGSIQDDNEYFQLVADVNGDGIINILDYQALYEIVRSQAEAVDDPGDVRTKIFTVEVQGKDGRLISMEVETDKTILSTVLLERGIIAGEQTEYGLYVTTVNGETAKYDEDGAYWAFYINGEISMAGVDAITIEAGTIYTFRRE